MYLRSRGLATSLLLAAVGALISALMAGCKNDAPGSHAGAHSDAVNKTADNNASTESSDPDLERLRSLPYAGWTDAEPTEDAPAEQPIEQGKSYPRYNLYNSRDACEAVLINMQKDVINRWSLPHRYWSHVELLPDGDLMVLGAEVVPGMRKIGISTGNYLLRMTWEGEVVFKTHVPAHHDFQILPDARIVTLLVEYRVITAYHPTIEMLNNLVGILSEAGNPVETVSVYDLFAAHPDILPLQRVPVSRSPDGPFLDPFHCNSVEWLEPASTLRGEHGADLRAIPRPRFCPRLEDQNSGLDMGPRRARLPASCVVT